MRSVLVTGGTGLVGGSVLRILLESGSVHRVVSLGRRTTGIANVKLKEVHIDDFGDPAHLAPHLEGVDAVFHCLATYSNKVDRATYRMVTIDWLGALLRATTDAAPAATFCLLSASGTRTDGGGVLWALRVKGEAENLLFQTNLPRRYAFRPAYIAPSRPREKGNIADSFMTPVFRALPFLGISSDVLGRAMLLTWEREERASAVFENGEMRSMVTGRGSEPIS